MGNLFSMETEPEKPILTDASNNSIIRDASGNIIPILHNDVIKCENVFNAHKFGAVLAPIDIFGNRVRKR
jgi:hypothetical protein